MNELKERNRMNISAEEREKIYFEEKAKREESRDNSPLWMMGLMISAAAALAIIVTIAASSDEDVTIDDLRKAYSGLSPDDEDQES